MTFLVFACLGSLWALANPLFSVPDEPAHLLRAVSASRGQILPGEREDKPYLTKVRVPQIFADARWVAVCYIGQPNVPAGCSPPLSGSDEMVTDATTAGTYPPAFYTVVGLPSLGFRSATGVYLMRVLSVAICSALLASAFESVWTLRSSWLATAGIALAVTPMVLFLAGSLNPSGVETAAAIGLWASLAVALGQTTSEPSNRLLVRIAVAGSVLALSRPASPLWLALIVGTLALWVGYRRVLDFMRDRRTWPVAAVVGAAGAFTFVWVASFGTLEEMPGYTGLGGGPLDNVHRALGDTSTQVDQMLGVFGWLDMGPARLSIYIWLFAVATLVLLAWVASTWRQAAALVATIVGVILVPVLLQLPQAGTQGFPWQGRYTLPLAVGVPILAGLQVDRARILPDQIARRLGLVLLTLFVAGQLYAHIWATRRYTAGEDGRLNWLAAGGWHPPIPAWALFAGFLVALPLAARWLHTRHPGLPDRPLALPPPARLKRHQALRQGSTDNPMAATHRVDAGA